MLPTLRVLFGHIAACCGSMATAMKHRKGLRQVRLQLNFLKAYASF